MDVETMSLVTHPSLMAAPRHHACAVHEKETPSGRADLRSDEKMSTIQEAVQARSRGTRALDSDPAWEVSWRNGRRKRCGESVTTSFGVWRCLCFCLCLFAFCGATLKAKSGAVRAPIGCGSEVCWD